MRFNTDTKLVEQYNGVEWVSLNSYGVGRGVFGGDYYIEYITISSLGNASYFGNLFYTDAWYAGCSSSTRGVFGGGGGSAPAKTNVIQYITISTTGNSTDFGDLTQARGVLGACSSSTRGVYGGGGATSNVFQNTIDYITIATTGNATDFGDLTVARWGLAACSSSTRGVFGGGVTTGTPANIDLNTIDYITIATTGNATDFGDLTQLRTYTSACSSSTRGISGGGYDPSVPVNTIDYLTIATTGNASDFGDLTQARTGLSACSSNTRGVFGGGYNNIPTFIPYNTIDYITIASNGTNAQDFGDLSATQIALGTFSDAHGGLQ
jgi:hypothetical protein